MIDESRRRFLKHGAATIAGASLIGSVGSVAADSGVDPLVLKGTPDRPISVDHIEQRREEYLRNHLEGRSDTLDEVVVGTPIVSETEFVAGYGLAFENGAPVEFVRPVSEPEDADWLAVPNDVEVETQETNDPVDAAHESVDAFASRHSDGSVSTNSGAIGPQQEPKWDLIGVIELENTVRLTVDTDRKRTKRAGKIDLAAEVYRGFENNEGRAYWTGKLIAKQWPGTDLNPGWGDYYNLETVMGQDWSAGPTRSSDLDLIKHAPNTNKTSDLDFSFTIGGGTSGGQSGITASYDVPYMRRVDESRPDRSVAHKYGYPSDEWWNDAPSKASQQNIQVENIGEFLMFPPSQGYESLCDIRMEGVFGHPEMDFWPDRSATVSASVSPFDLA